MAAATASNPSPSDAYRPHPRPHRRAPRGYRELKSETYWELKTRYREVIFSADKGKYSDKTKADAALKSITGEPFTITSVKKKDGKESAPKLFDLTSLPGSVQP